eukprot:SAG11_NODE_203_length_12529_cov_6.036444_12_plen_91_part_00
MNLDRPVDPDGSPCTNIAQGPGISLISDSISIPFPSTHDDAVQAMPSLMDASGLHFIQTFLCSLVLLSPKESHFVAVGSNLRHEIRRDND